MASTEQVSKEEPHRQLQYLNSGQQQTHSFTHNLRSFHCVDCGRCCEDDAGWFRTHGKHH